MGLMPGYLLDTNSVIYFFDGEETISGLIENAKEQIFISCITKIELLCFETDDKAEVKDIDSFLKEVEILYFDDDIIDSAVSYRKSYKLKLPDAIIAATAKVRRLSLVTADKAFQKIPDIEIISPI